MLPPRTRGVATLEDGCVRIVVHRDATLSFLSRLEGTVHALAALWSAGNSHGELVANIEEIVGGLHG